MGSPDEISTEPALVPDYTFSDEKVLKDVAIYLLYARRSLDILCGVGWENPSLRSKLPSWVPSWDTKKGRQLQPYLEPIYTLTHNPPNPAEFYLSTDENVLTVKAYVIDRIHIVGSIAKPSEDHKLLSILSYTRALFKSWEEDCLMRMCETFDSTVDDMMPVWLETLFHGVKSRGLEHTLYLILMGHEDESVLPDVPEAELERLLGLFCQMELDRLTGQSPFATNNGWIGITTERVKVEKGELVVLFQGCTTPFVLYDVGEAYSLVGSCYLWTHMYDNPQMHALKSLKYEHWISIV